MIQISKALLNQIYEHAGSSYPNECCGLMIGTLGETTVVHAVRRCHNLNQERSRDRYDLDPQDMLRVQREFENGPWEIIGVYHSHPDHPSRPSQFDTDRAWPGYSYVIVSVNHGAIGSIQSWVLREAGRQFEEEPLIIEDRKEEEK